MTLVEAPVVRVSQATVAVSLASVEPPPGIVASAVRSAMGAALLVQVQHQAYHQVARLHSVGTPCANRAGLQQARRVATVHTTVGRASPSVT